MQLLKAWTFKGWEIGVIKICLISFGIILGLYFYDTLIGWMRLWWTFFAVTAVYFIVKWVREK